MKRATEFHHQAIALAERADLAKAQQDFETAKRLYQEAFELERKAAFEFLNKPSIEPTRSVLFRSAASLALDSGEFLQAERMICHGLAAEPPVDIRVELRQLYEQMHFRLFLHDSGLKLVEQQIVLSLWGTQISPDFVPSREVVRRLTKAERLIHRTAERKSGLPFRETSDAPAEIRAHFPVYQRMPMAASYAIILQVGQGKRQLTLPYSIDAADVVSEVIDCMTLYNGEDAPELESRIEDPAYRRNFVSLAKSLYPTTGIDGVGFAGVSPSGEMRIVELAKPPQIKFDGSDTNDDENRTGQPVTVIGILNFAKSTTRTRRVEIKDDAGNSHAIDVPEGMMADVVRPHFEARVIVDAMQFHDGTTRLLDVRAEAEETDTSSQSSAS